MLVAMHRRITLRLARPPRRPGVAMLALLWLLIALMPLRALSQELMGAAKRADRTSVVSMAAMPCHAGMGHAGVDGRTGHHASGAGTTITPTMAATADAVDVAELADVAASDEPASNCNACDLCHAALAGPVAFTQDLSMPAAVDRPATPPGPGTAVAPDGIFKPPRG